MKNNPPIYHNGKFCDMYDLEPSETNGQYVALDIVVTYDNISSEPVISTDVNGTPVDVIGVDKKAVPPLGD